MRYLCPIATSLLLEMHRLAGFMIQHGPVAGTTSCQVVACTADHAPVEEVDLGIVPVEQARDFFQR